MGYFGLVGFLAILGAVLWFVWPTIFSAAIGSPRGGDRGEILEKSKKAARLARAITLGVSLLVFVLATAFGSVNQIRTGHIGIVYTFGAITSQVPEGLQIVAPWKDLKEANIQILRYKSDLACFSKETQSVKVQASVNYRTSPDAIQELYRSVGENYQQILIDSRLQQIFKDEIVKYTSVEIAPQREAIRKSAAKRLEEELKAFSVTVVDLFLDNIDFEEAFEHAVEQKQIATQKALEEFEKVKVEQHKAEQAVERAKGEGAALLAKAEKESEANRKLAESITQPLVNYMIAQKLSDKIQVMILPAGQQFILGSDMVTPKK